MIRKYNSRVRRQRKNYEIRFYRHKHIKGAVWAVKDFEWFEEECYWSSRVMFSPTDHPQDWELVNDPVCYLTHCKPSIRKLAVLVVKEKNEKSR